MSTGQFARLQAAAIDGRAHNVFFRHTQLERLFQGLLAEEANLRDAMINDSKYTLAEAIAVLHASMQVIRGSYDGIQPNQALEEEYRIAHGKDASNAETPVGLVYVEPHPHTLLYSVCAAVGPAIAAGNCVIVLLENNLQKLPALVRQVLTKALDAHVFAIASSPIKDPEILGEAMSVLQTSTRASPKITELAGGANTTSIALVDRTADVASAVDSIVQARTVFGARSPYAPDTVLVNEFVLQSFIEAVRMRIGDVSSKVSLKDNLPAEGKAEPLEFDLRSGELSVVRSGSSFPRTEAKPNSEPVLRVWPTRSLDDAINILDQANAPYRAAYHFCNLPSAKYLAQFVNAEVTFINHIPPQLLLGPALPTGQPFDLESRYAVSSFAHRRPVFVAAAPLTQELRKVLATPDNASARGLLEQTTMPLKIMKRSEGGGVGFFEQGFLMNASFILMSTLALTSVGAWQLWKYRSSR